MDPKTTLVGITLSVLFVAILLTIPITVILQWLYRRAVLKAMKSTSGAQDAIVHGETPQPPAQKPQLKFVRLTAESAKQSNPWPRLVERKQRLLAIVYGISGLAFISIFTLTFLISDFTSITLGRFIVLLLIESWPLLVTSNMMLARDRTITTRIVGIYFVVFSLFVLFLGITGIASASLFDFWLSWLIFNLPPYIFLQLIISRPVRSVAPIVFTMMLAVAAGIVVPLSILNPDGLEFLFNGVFNILAAFGLQSLSTLVFLGIFMVVGLIVAIPIGIFVIRLLSNQYRQKKTSDQFIVDDLVWLIYACYWTLMQITINPLWILAGALSFAVYKMTLWLGLRFVQQRQSHVPSMLLLRVFSLGKRSEEFYERLSKFWRYMGTIQFIIGPDLLKSTLQPHRFIEFLGGNLPSRVVNSRVALDRRMHEIDRAPDPDGRYRINDFLCQDSTWKLALKRLANDCDIVLMDLRSFSSRNAGCRYEINALFQLVPLRRVIFIIDHTTDREFLQQAMKNAWENLEADSPNALGNGQINYFEYNSTAWKEFRTLLNTATEILPA